MTEWEGVGNEARTVAEKAEARRNRDIPEHLEATLLQRLPADPAVARVFSTAKEMWRKGLLDLREIEGHGLVVRFTEEQERALDAYLDHP